MKEIVINQRPWLLLEHFERKYLQRNIAEFLHYVKTQRKLQPPSPSVRVQQGNDEVVVVEPEPIIAEPESEIDFIPETQNQKRTRKPREARTKEGGSEAAPFYDRTLKDRIVTFVNEQGPVTAADISQQFEMHYRRTSVVLSDMKKQKRIFEVGYKKNEHNQVVKVLHTDPKFVYISSDLSEAEAIIEDKRPARVTSHAAKERGRSLVARNFRSDSIASQVFEQIAMRPRSSPELETLFRSGNSRMKFMLDRMQDLKIIEQIGQERNPVSGKMRVLFGVVDATDAPKTERIPPSLETIAKGRDLIVSRCIRHGGKTLECFDELCAHGPLTRGDLAERLSCHSTMIDVAMRTLDKFGLVVDLGKAMGDETGKMRRLWDVKA